MSATRITSTPVSPTEAVTSDLNANIKGPEEVVDSNSKASKLAQVALDNWNKWRTEVTDRHPPFRYLPPQFTADEGDEECVDKPLLVWGIPFSNEHLHAWARRKGLHTRDTMLLQALVADLKGKIGAPLRWSIPISRDYSYIIVLYNNFWMTPSRYRREAHKMRVIREELQTPEKTRWWWDATNDFEDRWPAVKKLDFYVGNSDDDERRFGHEDEDEDQEEDEEEEEMEDDDDSDDEGEDKEIGDDADDQDEDSDETAHADQDEDDS